jgi:RHS repeat-associated protein
VETWRAYPYGEQWQQSGGAGATHRYTGQERDTESANDYFGARYYWSGAGRWLSVDPVDGNRIAPEQFGRYTYVLNDPIDNTDPDGRETVAIWRPGAVLTPSEERQHGPGALFCATRPGTQNTPQTGWWQCRLYIEYCDSQLVKCVKSGWSLYKRCLDSCSAYPPTVAPGCYMSCQYLLIGWTDYCVLRYVVCLYSAIRLCSAGP